MAFVIDASIVAAGVLPDESSPLADAALDAAPVDHPLAPALFWHEVRSVLLNAERRRRLSPGEADAHLRDLRLLGVRIAPELDDGEILALARVQNLTAYDAAYLALAAQEKIPIATLDEDIRRAAPKIGVALWGEGAPR